MHLAFSKNKTDVLIEFFRGFYSILFLLLADLKTREYERS